MAEYSWNPSQTEIISSLENELLREIKFKVEKKESNLNSYWERARNESSSLRLGDDGVRLGVDGRRFQGGTSTLSLNESTDRINQTLMNINSYYGGSDFDPYGADPHRQESQRVGSKVSTVDEVSDTPRSNIQNSLENYFVSLEDRLTTLEKTYADVKSSLELQKQDSVTMSHVKDIEVKIENMTSNLRVNIQESALAPIKNMLETLADEFLPRKHFTYIKDQVENMQVEIKTCQESLETLSAKCDAVELKGETLEQECRDLQETFKQSVTEQENVRKTFLERFRLLEEHLQEERHEVKQESSEQAISSSSDELATYFIPKKFFFEMYTRLKCMEHLLSRLLRPYLGDRPPDSLPEIIKKLNQENPFPMVTSGFLESFVKKDEMRRVESRIDKLETDVTLQSSSCVNLDSRMLPVSLANDLDLLNMKVAMLKEEQVSRLEFDKLERGVAEVLRKWDGIKSRLEAVDRKMSQHDVRRDGVTSDERMSRMVKKTLSSLVLTEMNKLGASCTGLKPPTNLTSPAVSSEEVLRIPARSSGILSVLVLGDRTNITDKLALLVIHDLGMNGGHMKDLLWSHFQSHQAKMLFVFVNIPGQEEYDYDIEPDRPFTDLEVMSRDLVCVLDTLAVSSVVCLGAGVGSFVAAQFIINHPTRSSALIMIDPTSNPSGILTKIHRKFGDLLTNKEDYLVPDCKLYSLLMRLGSKLVDAVKESGDGLRETCDHFSEECKFVINPRNLGLFYDSCKRSTDITRFLKSFLKSKALLLVGSNSPFVESARETFESMDKSRTKLIELDGIERTLFENPARLVSLIVRFLEDMKML